MGRDDRLGIVDQEPGRPERVVEPVPGLLERGRETAVDDAHGHLRRKESIDRVPTLLEPALV